MDKAATRPANIIRAYPPFAIAKGLSRRRPVTAGLSGSAGGWLSPVKVNFSGSVTHSSNTVSTSDRRAVYTVSVKATDHGMPPGLIKVLDILSASVSTVPTPAP